jgi:hypothetical protein
LLATALGRKGVPVHLYETYPVSSNAQQAERGNNAHARRRRVGVLLTWRARQALKAVRFSESVLRDITMPIDGRLVHSDPSSHLYRWRLPNSSRFGQLLAVDREVCVCNEVLHVCECVPCMCSAPHSDDVRFVFRVTPCYAPDLLPLFRAPSVCVVCLSPHLSLSLSLSLCLAVWRCLARN